MNKIINTIKDNYLIIIFSLLTTIIFFNQQIFGNSFFWEDFLEYVYPVQTFAARESGLFDVPFWNPFSFNGMPFFADLQVGFFYPLHRILNLFISSDGYLPVGILQLIIIIHFVISQLNTYFLARSFGISKNASLVSAISYSFSMILVVHVIHPMMLYHLAWFPLIFNLFRQSLITNNTKYGILAGLVFGFTMLSGHPQSTLYVAFFLLLYMIYYIIFESKKDKIFVNLLLSALPILIAFGIFAVQYLPSTELAELSQRDESTYELVSEGSLQLKQTVTMILPEVFGKITGNPQENPNSFYLQFADGYKTHYYWETSFYFGVIALVFSLFQLIVNYKDKTSIFLLAMSLFALFYSFGSNFFLHKLFYNLPLFDTFRNPGRILFYLTLSMSLLAGFGIDALNKKTFKLILIPTTLVLLFTLIGISGFYTSNLQINPELISSINSSFTINLFYVIVILGVAFLITKQKKLTHYLVIILALVSFVDLYIAGSKFNQSPVNPQEKYALNSELKSIFKINPPNEIFRVNMRMYSPSYMAMNRSQGLVDNIMLVEGYNPLLLKRPVPRLATKEQIHDILNVKYEIGIDKNTNQPRFYERFDRFPHFWAVNQYSIFNESNILDKISTTDEDLRKTVYLESNPKIKLEENENLEFEFKTKTYSNDLIEIETESNQNSIMVMSEIYYPAWKAYIDSNETPILQADYALRAIELPKGKHKIKIVYESSSFATGKWITIITLLLSIIGLILPKFMKK
jgi:hypothetical protein